MLINIFLLKVVYRCCIYYIILLHHILSNSNLRHLLISPVINSIVNIYERLQEYTNRKG